MQDLLLAQKRDRPAYCFQHLNLELRSHDGSLGANFAAASATPAPCPLSQRVSSRSGIRLSPNNTRFINILEEIRDTLCTVLLHSLRRRKVPRQDPAQQGNQVSMIAGGEFGRQAPERLRQQVYAATTPSRAATIP